METILVAVGSSCGPKVNAVRDALAAVGESDIMGL